MPSKKNIDQAQQLVDQIKTSKAVILTDYSGLSVSSQNELRQKITEAGGTFSVAKNNLFRVAIKEVNKSLSPELDEALNGPTAFLFAQKDEIAPIKALVEFAKKNELPKTKIGLLFEPEDRILSLDEIEKLSQLPTKDQLIGQLIGTLNAPTYRLVNALSGNLRKLALLLNEIKKQKQAN